MRLAVPLLLLGSFAFGYNAATALHELGHALAVWSVGGTVTSMTIHPFSWSYTAYGRCPAEYEEMATWAGAVFGLAGSLLLTGLGRLCRSPFAAPLLMTGIAACFYNGLYFLVDSLAGTGGDAEFLHRNGTPLWILIAFGLAAVGAGVFLASRLLPWLGASPTDGLQDRIITFLTGFGPYLLAMWLYHVVMGDQVILWGIYSVAGLIVVAIVGAASVYTTRWKATEGASLITLRPAVFSLLLGIGTVLLELGFTT